MLSSSGYHSDGVALVAVYTFRVAAVGSGQKMGPFSNFVNTVPYCGNEPQSSCDSSFASLSTGECGKCFNCIGTPMSSLVVAKHSATFCI